MKICNTHSPVPLFIRPPTMQERVWVDYSLARYDRYVVCSQCQLIGHWVDGKLTWMTSDSADAKEIRDAAWLWNAFMKDI